jgi:Integrase zinc binding domain
MHNLRRAENGNQGKPSKETYRFFIKNNLIYYADPADERRRLCIFSTMEKEIFKMAHDERNHAGFHRAYNTIMANFYIKNLSRRLKLYIAYCLSCGYLQITRYVPYGALHPVVNLPISFYTVTADFILALPKTKKGLNQIMSLTCKYTKKIRLIPGKDTWSAED